MKTIEQVIEYLENRIKDLYEQCRAIAQEDGTNNIGYDYARSAYEEATYILVDIKGENE